MCFRCLLNLLNFEVGVLNIIVFLKEYFFLVDKDGILKEEIIWLVLFWLKERVFLGFCGFEDNIFDVIYFIGLIISWECDLLIVIFKRFDVFLFFDFDNDVFKR